MVGLTKTVLIVDDSSSVRQQVAMALVVAGFDIVHARMARRVWRMVDSNRHIDLVICDINMPRR